MALWILFSSHKQETRVPRDTDNENLPRAVNRIILAVRSIWLADQAGRRLGRLQPRDGITGHTQRLSPDRWPCHRKAAKRFHSYKPCWELFFDVLMRIISTHFHSALAPQTFFTLGTVLVYCFMVIDSRVG